MPYYNENYNRGRGHGDLFTPGVILAVLALAFAVIILAISCGDSIITASYVTDGAALTRFREQAGTDNVKIVRNNRSKFEQSNDVTYELLINGKSVSGRCTKSFSSSLVCRLYASGVGD